VQDIIVERPAAGVVQLTLHRPEFRNALRTQTLAEIAAELSAALADPEIKVVVLTGGLECFAAGADVREMAPLGPIDILTHERQRHWRAIATFAKPLVGAVCGYALGGGCELAMACTLRIAADTARLGQPEIALGLIPGYAGTQRLPRLVGKGRAMGMILTGAPIAADEALRIGLVNRVSPAADLMADARKLAAQLAMSAPIAMRYIINAVNKGIEMPFAEACQYEATLFGLVTSTDDMREGTTAFLEKRRPEFKGR
jgi:enoyl-CoA hydratase